MLKSIRGVGSGVFIHYSPSSEMRLKAYRYNVERDLILKRIEYLIFLYTGNENFVNSSNLKFDIKGDNDQN